MVGGGECVCVFMTLTPSLCSRRSSGPTWRPSPSRSTLSYRTSRACLWCWARHCGSGLNCSPSTRNSVHSSSIQSFISPEPKITSGQRSISVQTTERTAQMITRLVIMTDRVNTPINHICDRAMPGPAPVRRERGDRSIVRTYVRTYIYIYIYIVDRCFDARSLAYSLASPVPRLLPPSAQ